MSLSIVLLTALAGLAVDLGNWYWHADRLQKAADAASLAGAPYLPGDKAKAFAAAKETLVANGFDASNIGSQGGNNPIDEAGANAYKPSAYIIQDPAHPSRLKVTAGVKVHNVLLGLIGVHDEWLTRAADGQYRQAVLMGSPGNVLGSEALQGGQTTVQGDDNNDALHNSSYWLNIAGSASDKVSGDRYSAGKCSNGVDECNDNGANAEVTKVDGKNSHQYIVHIPKSLDGQTVTLQAFDAAFVDVGDHCDTLYGAQLGSAELKAFAQDTLHQDPAIYDGGAGAFCSGDYDQGNGGNAPKLTFTVRKANDQQNPTGDAIATKSFPGYNFTNGTTLLQHLQDDGDLAKSFRRWSDVATFTHAGDYVITASTPTGAGGANRFSLRLGVGYSDDSDNGKGYWDTNAAGRVSVYAKQALAVYTNAVSNNTAFYFAKLTDSAAGRNLTIELYDIGDVPTGESVDLQMVPPSSVQGGAVAFQSCSYQDPTTKDYQTSYNCEIDGANSDRFNGKVIKLKLQISPDYRCTDDGGKDCWMSLRFNLHGAGNTTASDPSTDTTTWQIDDCGNPVKLVKDGSGDEDACPGIED